MSQERNLISYKTTELELLFNVALNNSDIQMLTVLQSELAHRSRKNAKVLLERVNEALSQISSIGGDRSSQVHKIIKGLGAKTFGETLRAWRVYAERLADNPEFADDIHEIWDAIYEIWLNKTPQFFVFAAKEIKELKIDESPLAGILSYFGYRTRVKKSVRRTIVEELIYASLPPVVNHYEWGEPESEERFEKIRLTLSGLPFPHRDRKGYESAVAVWDDDHNWFIENHYPGSV